MFDHTPLLRKAIALAVPAITAGLLLGTFPAASTDAATTAQATSWRASFEHSGTGRVNTADAVTVVDKAWDRIGSGERELFASQGKVLNGASRARLTRALQYAASSTATADKAIVAQRRFASAVKRNPAARIIYVVAPGLFSQARPVPTNGIAGEIHDVEAAQKATSHDVQTWNTQNTIRVNQQKAAAAAAAAAAQRATPSHTSTTRTSGVYVENVWTSGFQTQLNACRGGVNLSAAYGVATIGEVWGCGGSRFPKAGAEVQLTGTMGGLYRVGPVVATLNAHTQSASDIPRGYALLYQTCLNGNASTETFTELTRIG